MPKHITKEQKEEIVKYYKAKPMTQDEVAQKFKISLPSVIKILKEYKVKIYNKVQLFSPNLNEHYFDIIDTEEKAYFLGLIITDGCVHNTKGKQPLVALTLQESDKYILERFKNAICSNKTVTNDGRGCVNINILSRIMVNSLRKYGIDERKSLHTIFPKNIPQELYPHLIRGILDGDGSVSFYARRGRKCHVKAVRFCQGNEQFLKDLIDCLYDNCGANKINTYQEKENLWSIAYRKDDSMMKIIQFLYKDATIYLTRKKHLCDLICNEIIKYGNTEITIESKESMVS